MPTSYKMSQEMYDSIRYPMYYDAKTKKMSRSRKPLTTKEVIEYINSNFGLLKEVNEIVIG